MGISAVINLSVPEAVLVDRLRGRSGAEQRADDRPEAVRNRLVVYREKTEPLIQFFRDRGVLTEVRGVGEVTEVAARVHQALGAPQSQGVA